MNYRFLILVFVCFVGASFSINFLQAQDARPVVDDSKETPDKILNPKLSTLFIVGDSTLKSNQPMRGWGQELARFLTRIN